MASKKPLRVNDASVPTTITTPPETASGAVALPDMIQLYPWYRCRRMVEMSRRRVSVSTLCAYLDKMAALKGQTVQRGKTRRLFEGLHPLVTEPVRWLTYCLEEMDRINAKPDRIAEVHYRGQGDDEECTVFVNRVAADTKESAE